jgi:F-type H+-transporting ATPase subunit delta
MADEQAARRYAQAVLDLAVEADSIAVWRADLEDVARVLTDSDAAPVFADSRLPVEQRQAMLERVLDVQPLSLNLARLLVARGRSLDARAVAEWFNRMADEREGIAHATVTTAVDLTPEQLQGIERRLSEGLGQRVVIQATTDPAIIGGIVMRVGDRLIDGSVRTRLKQLRRELEGAR